MQSFRDTGSLCDFILVQLCFSSRVPVISFFEMPFFFVSVEIMRDLVVGVLAVEGAIREFVYAIIALFVQ
jgi:hypothetical protein